MDRDGRSNWQSSPRTGPRIQTCRSLLDPSRYGLWCYSENAVSRPDLRYPGRELDHTSTKYTQANSAAESILARHRFPSISLYHSLFIDTRKKYEIMITLIDLFMFLYICL